uniref:Uncharacterized protein n=1 Tax=Anguilla anguilla TaxID=7936 RepID=A0A0E9QYT1_ANGAN
MLYVKHLLSIYFMKCILGYVFCFLLVGSDLLQCTVAHFVSVM